jgi:hypothetical protein
MLKLLQAFIIESLHYPNMLQGLRFVPYYLSFDYPIFFSRLEINDILKVATV